jgi:hypothetical protein
MKPFAIFNIGLSLSVLLASASVRADDGIPPPPTAMDPGSAVNPSSIVSGAGVRVGEGTTLRPQVGIETGYVSNVFYTNNAPISAGLLRVLAEIGAGSLPNQRLLERSTSQGIDPNDALQSATYGGNPTAAGDFQYSFNLYAAYDQYLSGNDAVTSQGGLSGGVLFRGIVNPERPLQLAFQEHFEREIRATNFESNDDLNRDVNNLDLRINLFPTGRSLGGFLYYQNTIDVFEEGQQQFANRMQNVLGLHVNWQWLPLTRVYVDVSGGYYTGLGTKSEKINSSRSPASRPRCRSTRSSTRTPATPTASTRRGRATRARSAARSSATATARSVASPCATASSTRTRSTRTSIAITSCRPRSSSSSCRSSSTCGPRFASASTTARS